MSDLRLEDLRAMDSVDGVIVGRRVSCREVLEALGAEKRWMCEVPELNAYRCDGEAPAGAVHPAWLRKHSICGWVWVVDDGS